MNFKWKRNCLLLLLSSQYLPAFCQTETKLFKESNGIYQLSYPGSWNPYSVSGDMKFAVAAPKEAGQNLKYPTTVKVQVIKMSPGYENITIEDLAVIDEGLEKKQKVKGFSKSFIKATTQRINGKTWWVYEYTLEGSYNWHVRFWKTVHNSIDYTVLYSGMVDDFPNHLQEAEATINSFTFLQKDLTAYKNKPADSAAYKIVAVQQTPSKFKEIEPMPEPGSTGTITFKYRNSIVTYNTVRANDGNIWLQQNLGSLHVATSLADKEAYGDLFQWGRWDDGHQVRSPANTSRTELDQNNPLGIKSSNYNAFYYGGIGGWWLHEAATDTWTAETPEQVTSTNGCDPCKAIGPGWSLPASSQLTTLMNSERFSDLNGAFLSNMKFTASGTRDHTFNNIIDEERGGYCWSSNPSLGLFIFLNRASVSGSTRGYGVSIRCMRLAGTKPTNAITNLQDPALLNNVYSLNTNQPLEKATATVKEVSNDFEDVKLAKMIEVSSETSTLKLSSDEASSFIIKTGGAINPSITLHKLVVENKKRYGLSARNLFQPSTADQTIVNLNIVKIKEGVYQLTPTKILDKGEYFFAPKDVIRKPTTTVFAFSVVK